MRLMADFSRTEYRQHGGDVGVLIKHLFAEMSHTVESITYLGGNVVDVEITTVCGDWNNSTTLQVSLPDWLPVDDKEQA